MSKRKSGRIRRGAKKDYIESVYDMDELRKKIAPNIAMHKVGK